MERVYCVEFHRIGHDSVGSTRNRYLQRVRSSIGVWWQDVCWPSLSARTEALDALCLPIYGNGYCHIKDTKSETFGLPVTHCALSAYLTNIVCKHMHTHTGRIMRLSIAYSASLNDVHFRGGKWRAFQDWYWQSTRPGVVCIDDAHQRPCSIVGARPETWVEANPTIRFTDGEQHLGKEHDLLHPAHLTLHHTRTTGAFFGGCLYRIVLLPCIHWQKHDLLQYDL